MKDLKLETKSAKEQEAESVANQLTQAKDAFGQFQQQLQGLPKDIATAVTESLISAEHKPLELADGQTVTVLDFDKAHQTINEVRERLVSESKQALRKGDIKTDPALISSLNSLGKATQALAGREFKVVVNAPDSVSIENWPTKVSEALPVRLVDAEGKKFYDAIAQVGDVVGGILGARIDTANSNLLTNEQLRATPVPVSVEGDVTITGDVIVDQVGIENVAGTKINPSTEEKQDAIITELQTIQPQTDALTDTELRATPIDVDTGLTTQTDALTDTELRATPVDVDTGLTQPTTPADTQPVSLVSLPQGDAPTAVFNNQVTVATAGTRVVLSANTVVSGAIIQAMDANSGNVFVGSSTVTASNGFELQPGQATSVAIDNLNKIYVDAATNGDKICYIAF